jgi:hypothetical protein
MKKESIARSYSCRSIGCTGCTSLRNPRHVSVGDVRSWLPIQEIGYRCIEKLRIARRCKTDGTDVPTWSFWLLRDPVIGGGISAMLNNSAGVLRRFDFSQDPVRSNQGQSFISSQKLFGNTVLRAAAGSSPSLVGSSLCLLRVK